MDFAVPADHGVKLMESRKRDKYLDLAKELKKKPMEYEGEGDTDCNLGTGYVHQRLVQRLEDLEMRGRVETIKTTALLGSARILRRFQET